MRDFRKKEKIAFSLIEVVISMFVISVLFVASVQTLAWSQKVTITNMNEEVAQSLATSLMDEILLQAYQSQIYYDAGTDTSAQGRVNYTAVSDYHNYAEARIKDKDGNVRDELVGWGRKVVVHFIDPATRQTIDTDKGIKRVIVYVTLNSVVQKQLVAYKYDEDRPF